MALRMTSRITPPCIRRGQSAGSTTLARATRSDRPLIDSPKLSIGPSEGRFFCGRRMVRAVLGTLVLGEDRRLDGGTVGAIRRARLRSIGARLGVALRDRFLLAVRRGWRGAYGSAHVGRSAHVGA